MNMKPDSLSLCTYEINALATKHKQYAINLKIIKRLCRNISKCKMTAIQCSCIKFSV